MPTYKGVEINTKPTEAMANEAQRGLDWRSEFGRGGTEVGIARARDISNRSELSFSTVKRMVSFFARHEVDKQAEGFRPGEKGYPSNGRIAHALWGGNSGRSWANAIRDRLDKIDDDERSSNAGKLSIAELDMEERDMERAEADELKIGDFVKWDSSGGMARGQIDEVVRDGQIEVPDSDVVINGEPDDPAALIRIFQDGEPTDTMVGHRFSTLTKIDAIESSERDSHYEDEDERGDDDKERKAAPEVIHRAQGMDAGAVDQDTRRVRMSISSEHPVERSFGMEVLEHSDEAVDLSFLNSGRAPLLLDHDPERQIGVIESVDLDGSARRLRATVRFGKGPLASEVFDDVADGIRSNISIGYAINKMERKDKDTYVAKSWRPLEASIVSLPADTSDRVGVGRSGQAPSISVESNNPQEGQKMTDQVDIAAVEAEARKAAQKSASQIIDLGARHNQSDLARKAISEGRSIEEFRGELLEVIGSNRALEDQDIGLKPQEVKRFSIVRAINALANPHDRRAQEEAAFEFECSRAASEAYGRTARGVMLPAEVLRNWKRDLNTSDDSNVLTEDFRGSEFIDVLRNQSSVMQAGARMLNGLQSDVAIPKKATATSSAWLAAEGDDVAESEPTFGQITLSPKDLGAFTEVTRRMIQQSTLDIEALIRDDLAQAIALGMDLAALSGSGASGQPTGIKNTSGINTVDFGTAPDTVPTFAQVVEMETKLGEDNALSGNLAYILPASMFGALKTVEKATNTAQFVVEPGGTMNGYRAIVSNQCAAGDLFFMDASQLLVGMWGGLDLLIDPYTNSKSGTILIRAIQTMDVAVRHPVSFCLGNDGGS